MKTQEIKITHPMISIATQKEIEKYCKELGVKYDKNNWDIKRTDLHKALEEKAVDYPTHLSPYYLRFGNMIAEILTNPTFSQNLMDLVENTPLKINDVLIFPVFHTGGLGLRNRSKKLQLEDWMKIKDHLNSF